MSQSRSLGYPRKRVKLLIKHAGITIQWGKLPKFWSEPFTTPFFVWTSIKGSVNVVNMRSGV